MCYWKKFKINMTRGLNIVFVKIKTLTTVFLVKFKINIDNNLNIPYNNSSLTNMFLKI